MYRACWTITYPSGWENLSRKLGSVDFFSLSLSKKKGYLFGLFCFLLFEGNALFWDHWHFWRGTITNRHVLNMLLWFHYLMCNSAETLLISILCLVQMKEFFDKLRVLWQKVILLFYIYYYYYYLLSIMLCFRLEPLWYCAWHLSQ